jgi:hypothetical protein
MKRKVTLEQTKYVFENLLLLQHSIQSNCANLKRDHGSQTDADIYSAIEPAEQTPRKRSGISRLLFQEDAISETNARIPLSQLDENSMNHRVNKKGGNHGLRKPSKLEQTWRMKENIKTVHFKNLKTNKGNSVNEYGICLQQYASFSDKYLLLTQYIHSLPCLLSCISISLWIRINEAKKRMAALYTWL